MDKIKIGRFLKNLRHEMGLTQQDFARMYSKKYFGEIGFISDSTVSKWERGESLPNIDDIQRIASFYSISMDELLNGERIIEVDFNKKYFLSQNDWAQEFNDKDNLYSIREKNEMEIETRFKLLLKKMIEEGLSLCENKEFDFLVEHFFTVDVNVTSDDFSIVIKDIKFNILKTVALMHNSSIDEKFWEVYKLFKSVFRQTVKQDVCDAIEDAESILRERVCSLEDFEKDMLLAAIQIVNISNRYGVLEFNEGLYEKIYQRPYDEELLTKNAIRLLVECGAKLNPLLLGYCRKKTVEIDILQKLIELYKKFKKPLIVPVYEGNEYSFFEVENTPRNRKLYNLYDDCTVLDEAEYLDLERRLYSGNSILEKNVTEWVGGKTEDEMLNYMQSVINEISLSEYYSNRDNILTDDLIMHLDKLSLEEIRNQYFTKRVTL